MSSSSCHQQVNLALTLIVSLLGTFTVGVFDLVMADEGIRANGKPTNCQTKFLPGLARIDFSITTSNPVAWEGELQLSRGEFADLTQLGSKVSSSTDFLFTDSNKNCLSLFTRSRTTFCGVETTLLAPKDARLDIKLRDRQSGKTLVKTVFIDRLIDSAIKIPFDKAGNGIEIVRAPADELPIFIEVVEDDLSSEVGSSGIQTTIFKPNDTVRLTVIPRSITTQLPNEIVLSVYAKQQGKSAPFWSETRELSLEELQYIESIICNKTSGFSPCQFVFQAPDQEGVFEIVLELTNKVVTPNKTTFALTGNSKRKASPTVFARRSLQGFVTNAHSVSKNTSNAHNISLDDLRSELLETIDPTNASWYKVFSKRPFSSLYKPASKGKGGGILHSSAFIEQTNFRSDDVSTDQNSHKTFADSTFQETYVNNNAFNSITLGQAQNSEQTNSFNTVGKNILGLVPTLPSISKSNELLKNEQLYCLQRWQQDRFQSFIRDLNRKNWGETSNWWEKPLSSGRARPFNEEELSLFATNQTRFLRLAPNQIGTSTGEMFGTEIKTDSWEAYPIPIDVPGVPYILEIEYPANFPQKLDITILEQETTGGLFQSSYQFGFAVSNDVLSDRSTNEIARYTALFWPNTQTPIVVASNNSTKTAAAYGQIRIYRANNVEINRSQNKNGRKFGLALTTPDIVSQFAGPKSDSNFGVIGSEDWYSFDESISRMLYYLAANKIGSIILTVIGDGASIYPSKYINISSQYDGGAYLIGGGDPSKKDVLTAVLSKSVDCNKGIIPLVNLNFPLPTLEAKLRSLKSLPVGSQASLEGIEWIGVDRRKIIDTRITDDGRGPYYNVLHPEVEKEVLAIIGELTTKCSSYSSFEGLAIDVGNTGWLALPDDVYYGMDDETIARFVRESNLQEVLSTRSEHHVQELLLAKGEERYRVRAKFIHDVCLNEWIEWRVDALYRFYRKIRLTLAQTRPDLRLYLVTSNSLNGVMCRSELQPSLSSNNNKVRQALRLVGIDPYRFAPEPRKKNSVAQVAYSTGNPSNNQYDSLITLLRPEVISTYGSHSRSSFLDELNSPESISLFCANQFCPGTFFFHNAQNKRLESFNEQSPIHPTVAEIKSLALPAGYENLKRYARSLAIEDSLCFFDGGDVMPMGQEESFHGWIQVFSHLPNHSFRTWTAKSEINSKKLLEQGAIGEEKSIHPLVVRYSRTNKETWIYYLNVAPFHLGVKCLLNLNTVNSNYEIFIGERHEKPSVFGQTFEWNFTASPYELLAVRIDDPKVSIQLIDVACPQEICGTNGRLSNAVQDYVDRISVALSGLEQEFRNGDFEETLNTSSVQTESSKSIKPDKSNLLGFEMPKVALFKKPEEDTSSIQPAQEDEFMSIPGWRAFGPNDVDVQLDNEIVNQGKASLRISSTHNVGGVICQPFKAPTTGRLCVQISFGVKQDTPNLPLSVCLVGRYKDEQFIRRINVGQTILKRVKSVNSSNVQNGGVVWVRNSVLFDHLPLEGLENLSLRFEFCGPGVVWLDQIKLYKLVFVESEQAELMKILSSAEFRLAKNRIIDVLFMLDGYWAKLLKEEIKDDSPLLVSRVQRPKDETSVLPEKESQSPKKQSVFNRTMNKIKFW